MAVTTGMVGQGFHDRSPAPQLAAIEHVLPWLDEALGGLDLGDERAALRLSDYGCSDGRNSIAVMDRAVGALRRRTAQPVQTIHCDPRTHDVSELFLGLRSGGRSVFGDDVYSSCVGGSMFDQLLPPGSLQLATTFNAIGFLSARPVERLPGYILPNGPRAGSRVGSVSEQERDTFARRARDDVATFASARAAELAPGGKLLVQVFGAGEERRTCDGIYDVLNAALLEALRAGLLEREEYETYYQPVYFRTLDELVAPLTGEDGGLPALFEVDRAETYEVPVPFVTELEEAGEVPAYAADYTNFFRAFTEPVLRRHFAAHPFVDALVSEVYARAERMIRERPEDFELHYVALAVLLTRR